MDDHDDQILEHHLLDQLDHQSFSFWHRVRAKVVLDVLPSAGQTTVADLGAGAGIFGEILRRERPDVTYRFFEPLEALSAALADRFGASAALDGILDLDGADVVTLLDVIEHVADDRAILANVIEAMPHRSQLIVTVPAMPALWSQWDRSLGHHRRYTRESLRASVEDLPLEVDAITYLFPEMLPAAVVRRFHHRRNPHEVAAEMPRLPSWLDSILFGVSSATYRLRRWWPAGTSLSLVGRRRD